MCVYVWAFTRVRVDTRRCVRVRIFDLMFCARFGVALVPVGGGVVLLGETAPTCFSPAEGGGAVRGNGARMLLPGGGVWCCSGERRPLPSRWRRGVVLFEGTPPACFSLT